uniref:sodium-driven chloride bicarbonate exchanger-like isoform X2 n=1 Tax=Styela clava TaxID=7725 RepID=UPI00193A28CB|nr:sodium-driven chloride bicarbonate exchanger-like isoform X2 [Styela clava]
MPLGVPKRSPSKHFDSPVRHRASKTRRKESSTMHGWENGGYIRDSDAVIEIFGNDLSHPVHTLVDGEYAQTPWRIDQETQPILDQRKSSQAYLDVAASQHQNVYVGMHLPTWYNKDKLPSKRSKHHKRHHKSSKTPKPKEIEEEVLPPHQQVQFLLGSETQEDGGDTENCWKTPNGSMPRLFTEMEELYQDDDGDTIWKETARWIKFEECVEPGGDRWSKPHVATLSLHSLFELRSCIMNGVVQLDMVAQCIDQIADIVLDVMVSQGQLPHDDELRERVRDALLSGHEHQTEKKNGRLNPIKSVADMVNSRRESSFAVLPQIANAGSAAASPILSGRLKRQRRSSKQGASPHGSTSNVSHCSEAAPELASEPSSGVFEKDGHLAVPGDSAPRLVKQDGPSSPTDDSFPSNTSAPNLLHRKQTVTSIGPLSTDFGSSAGDNEKKDKKVPYFMKKIPAGAEASNVLVGEIDFLERPIIAFVRLQDSVQLEGLTEVPIPTRFLFILLGPVGNRKQYHEIGRSIATLMADEVFHDVAYKARTRRDLLAGIDEFLDQVTVLPPGEWDSTIRIEPPQDLPKNQMTRLQPKKNENTMENGHAKVEMAHAVGPELQRTGKLFGGLVADIKRKAPFFVSDFRDALSIQCVASFIFLYFAVLTPIVTFGGLLGDATHNYISAMESIFGAAMAGTAFHLFSGQPLTIIGSTGPILVFEKIMFDICTSAGMEYLPIRWWIGTWTGVFCIILVATDASSLVQYITRYTEETFSALISLIFIFEAFKKLISIGDKLQIWYGWNGDLVTFYGCECAAPNLTSYNITENLDYEQIKFESKEKALKSHGMHINGSLYRTDEAAYTCSYDGINFNVSDINNVTWNALDKPTCIESFCGHLVGESCPYTPDGMLMSVILFFGTFTISMYLKGLKLSRFFPTKVRSIISDFSVTIAIALMVLFDILMKLNTPKLLVPDSFRPTREDRTWLISPLGENEWWTIPLAIVPALLCTILIFMDQQITAVIVNRKENKLKKGCGYHLDLLVVSIMMILCSILGLPWFVAATVLSITHVNSLKMESESAAPGETPKFLGVREQRVTGIMIFVLIGLSVFMTPILAYIPMPVLYGVFLYMGVSSLKGVQFIDRCKLIFMPPKHQPDFIYLRHVPLPKVYLFTFFQVVGLVLLWVIKSTKPVSIIFPMMVAALVGVRKAFDYCIFSQEELFWLDDIMPESTKKRKEDSKKRKEQEDQNKQDLLAMSGQGTVNVPLQDGKVLKIPVSEIKYNPDEPTSINITKEMAQTAIWKTIVRNELGGSGTDLKEREKRSKKGKRKGAEEIIEPPQYSFPPKKTSSPPSKSPSRSPNMNSGNNHKLTVINEANKTNTTNNNDDDPPPFISVTIQDDDNEPQIKEDKL